MNTKTWNDLVGVSRGLWSVIQKAQTSSVRIHKMPRVPTYERLDNYSQKYSEKIRTQNEESILNQELYDIKQERIIKNVENQKEEKLMYEVNESQLQKKTQKEPKIDSLSQEFTEKLVTEEPEKAKEEEYIEDEISLKEKDMGYHETPFYLKQDRPVFTGKETKIPTSPSARALHFGALGISLVGGTISAALKQNLGISRPLPEVAGRRRLARYAMTDDNSNRLSNTLCKMRGAALKIGQILSNTEDSVIPPSMQRAFDKARQNADIMPKYQVIQMLERELGQDWESNFKEFNMYPIAAASIGQVHEGVLQDGTKVAIKIQYPNIARSIDSDFSNFKRLLKVLGAAPDSLYIDELFTNVKTELHEECDYIVEAEKQEYYKKMLD